jgi:hypothetical protein
MELQPQPVDLDNLPSYWQKVAELDEQAHQAMQSWHSMNFTPRFLDEGQPAGPRTYIGVTRLLNIAIDNQEAFQSLIQTHGVTHWSQWGLLRSVFEASFYALWTLDPADGRERRRRGLRLEVLDSKENKKWIDSLRDAGLDADAVAAYEEQHIKATRVYKEEAKVLGLNWERVGQRIDVAGELLKLNYTRERISDDMNKFFVSIWRRLSGFQHGFGYALLAGADKGRSITIPGGESVFLTTNDQDLVNTCKMVSAMHIFALQLVIERNSTTA